MEGRFKGVLREEREKHGKVTNTSLSVGSGSIEAGAQEQRDGQALDLVLLKSQRVQGPSI